MSPVVLGINGPTRGGSTATGIALANTLGGVMVGELHLFWNSYATGHSCACGVAVDQCQFWQEVLNAGGLSASEVRDWNVRMSRLRISTLFRQLPLYEQYRDVLRRLYEGIWFASEKRPIVDSSKYGPHLLALASIAELSSHHLYVWRPASAQIESWGRPKENPSADNGYMPVRTPERVVAEYALSTAFSIAIACRTRRRVLGLEIDRDRDAKHYARAVCASMETTSASPLVGQNHSVAGNPIRFQGRSQPTISLTQPPTRAHVRLAAAVTDFANRSLFAKPMKHPENGQSSPPHHNDA